MPEEYGAIIRTSAIGKNDAEIINDINKIVSKYKEIEEKFNEEKQNKNLKPQLIFKKRKHIRANANRFDRPRAK